MNASEAWTVGRLLTWTTDYLKQHESDSPRLDAEVLLAHALDCQRIELYTAFSDEPSEAAKSAFREMVRRRAAGTPVAYLVGYKEFYSDRFEVNPNVLIPRPETEHLVVEALDRAKQISAARGQENLRIADVGTGSGIVAISLAKHLPTSELVAIDVSAAALEVARSNASQHELTDRIEFVEGHLLTDIPQKPVFDLIVSNPPYVSDAEYAELPATVREHEPRGALVAGPTGMEVIAELMTMAVNHLAPDGYLLFEFSPMLAEKLPAYLGSDWALEKITKDLAGRPRVVTLRPAQAAQPGSV
ncbi:MAG: peptide chain release factor N(5)-glutamine methyltransferase [bacterium]|nr:peptide chain release factor N(5)-glutamine methyltransferase [bacterium]